MREAKQGTAEGIRKEGWKKKNERDICAYCVGIRQFREEKGEKAERKKSEKGKGKELKIKEQPGNCWREREKE